MSSATKAPGAEGPGAYGIPGLPDRLSQSDQLRIFSAYYADRLPAEAAAELCEFADEWDEQIASAPAPSDPAGAGGDLGELERLSAVREAEDEELYRIGKRDGREEAIQDVAGQLGLDDEYRWSTEPDRHQPGPDYMLRNIVEHVSALERDATAHRSGQLVASTPGQKGAGEEKTGATPLGSGSRPSDQAASHPVPAGFDLSRGHRDMRLRGSQTITWFHPDDAIPMETVIISGGIGYRKDGRWYTLTGQDSPGRPIEWEVTGWTPMLFAPEAPASCDGSAEGGETEGLDPKGNSAVGEAETPAQTPPSPPSATPEGDPPMTVEEAREVLNSFDTHVWPNPADYVSYLRKIACEVPHRPQYQQSCRTFASRIELALRTLHAAGEVRHG